MTTENKRPRKILSYQQMFDLTEIIRSDANKYGWFTHDAPTASSLTEAYTAHAGPNLTETHIKRIAKMLKITLTRTRKPDQERIARVNRGKPQKMRQARSAYAIIPHIAGVIMRLSAELGLAENDGTRAIRTYLDEHFSSLQQKSDPAGA